MSLRQRKWSSDVSARLDTFYIFLIPPNLRYSPIIKLSHRISKKRHAAEESKHLIYPRQLPQSYCIISSLLLCQACSYTSCLWKEKLSVLHNTMFMCSYGLWMRSGTIFSYLKIFLAFRNADKTTVWLPPLVSAFICCSVWWYWSQILPQTTPVLEVSQVSNADLQLTVAFKAAFFACSPAVWEIWSWTVVLGDSLFQHLSENLKNCRAKSCALELTHWREITLRSELLLPIAI